jgi:hypothetical protein
MIVSIPPAQSRFPVVVGDQVKLDYNWYMFFAYLFTQGSTFATEQNIVAMETFMSQSLPQSTSGGSGAPTDFSDANNILANQEFGG